MKTKLILSAISAAILTVSSTSASTITWSTPAPGLSLYDNDQVLDLAGPPSSEVYGVAFGGGGSSQSNYTTANGYTFTNEDPFAPYNITGNYVFTNPSPATVSNSLALAAGIPLSSTSGPNADPAFNTMMSNVVQNTVSYTYGEGELTGLKPGQTYTIEILVADNYTSTGDIPRQASANDGMGDTVTTDAYAQSSTSPTYMGAYILGTFTADGTGIQVLDTNIIGEGFTEAEGGAIQSGQGGFYDQAFLLTTDAVPEPSAYSMIFLGLGSLLAFRCWRGKWAGLKNSLQI